MAVAYRSSTQNNGVPNSNTNVTLPANAEAGDMLIACYAYFGDASSGLTANVQSSGGMTLVSESNVGNNRFFGVFRGILNATDITNNYVTISAGGGFSYSGHWFFICLSGSPSTSLFSSNFSTVVSGSSTPSFNNSVTPLSTSGISILFAISNGDRTASAYAIATDNPTYTEIFDTTSNSGVNFISMHLAYSNTRTSTNATGNSSLTLSNNADSAGFNILVEDPLNTNLTMPVGTLTVNGLEPSLSTNLNFTMPTGELTLNGQTPTIETSENTVWTNDTKPSPSIWTNDLQ